MRNLLGKKALLVTAAALALVALSAAFALGAPVLQPGTTSAPGMSGTCTDCHTYASAPKPKPTVSAPKTSSSTQKLSKKFAVWGSFPTSIAGTTDDTLTVTVQRYTKKIWTTVPSLTTTATISATGKVANATNYTLSLTINRAGSYRMRAKLVYLDSAKASQTKTSAWRKFSVKK